LLLKTRSLIIGATKVINKGKSPARLVEHGSARLGLQNPIRKLVGGMPRKRLYGPLSLAFDSLKVETAHFGRRSTHRPAALLAWPQPILIQLDSTTLPFIAADRKPGRCIVATGRVFLSTASPQCWYQVRHARSAVSLHEKIVCCREDAVSIAFWKW
jgi:hypothetical protein